MEAWHRRCADGCYLGATYNQTDHHGHEEQSDTPDATPSSDAESEEAKDGASAPSPLSWPGNDRHVGAVGRAQRDFLVGDKDLRRSPLRVSAHFSDGCL